MAILAEAWDWLCGGIGDFCNFLLANMDLVAFFILAAITVLGALFVISDKEVVHSAFYLGLVFACIAFLYFFLEAEFIAVIQMLIYVGAITILFAFSIMLTRRYIMKPDDDDEEGGDS